MQSYKTFHFRPTPMFSSVVWPKGKPPTDNPECGFNNELCEWLLNGKVSLMISAPLLLNYSTILYKILVYIQTPISSWFSGKADIFYHSLVWRDADIALLALLVSFPVIGILAVFCIGMLVLQKLRLQNRLDDSCWWLISYSDITIIREPSVCAVFGFNIVWHRQHTSRGQTTPCP